MVQTRSASGVDVPSTPAAGAGGRPRSSGGDTTGTVRRKSGRLTNGAGASPPGIGPGAGPSSAGGWTYVPDALTLLWLAVSLPLVAWDTGYVLLRPRTMPGGALHWPLWAPYALYGEVDHIYGFKQWHARNGFTAAQGALNLVESLLYLAFLALWHARGRPVPGAGLFPLLGSPRKGLVGRPAALAVLLAFSAAVMTLSKTVLYWLNEYFSGFDNIGHNDLSSLVFLWIIPNGLWLVFPAYMIYQLGGAMLDALARAPPVDPKA